MNFVLSVFLRPFVGFVMLCVAYVIARALYRVIPDGKVKRALFAPLPGQRQSARWRR